MKNISKSTYCDIWQCPKITWIKENKPEELEIEDSLMARFETGREVGKLARGFFGDYVNVISYNNDAVDYIKTINRTREEMNKGTQVICEASFEKDGLFCAVDILKRENDGYAIYEVKSSTQIEQIHVADIAFQKYVLEKCGVKVTGTYLVTLNSEYVLEGSLDISGLFKIENVDEDVQNEICNIEPNLETADKVLSSKEEPGIDLSARCNKPYKCVFWNYCTKNIGKPSVFDLYRMRFDKKLALYHEGLINFDMLENCAEIKNDKQKRQIDYYLHDKGTYIDKKKIREFLNNLSYPLYFLDFETMQPAVPEFQGTKPYQQIPFQYSLHYYESENSELMHKEFLAESGKDPRRKLAERLCEDIPMNVCVTAYNKSFECGRIRELADAFPDLADHLLNIEKNIVDLLVPFQSGYYYKKEMGGSFSIKSVLPALFPDDSIDSELDDLLYINEFNNSMYNPKDPDDYYAGPNLFLAGPSGSGKADVIKRWAKKNKLNYLELKSPELDIQNIKVVPFGASADDQMNSGSEKPAAQNSDDAAFNLLNAPGKSVLFIDELDRDFYKARTSILKIIRKHMIPDYTSPTGDCYLENLAFVIAAIPSDDDLPSRWWDFASFQSVDWEPGLNYHNLEGVHNGTEAMTIFPKIKDMPSDKQQEARHNLLKYCELDTYAMVKVWEKLVEAVR